MWVEADTGCDRGAYARLLHSGDPREKRSVGAAAAAAARGYRQG